MRQFRTENPIILAKTDVSEASGLKKGFNDAKILKPRRAHLFIVCTRKGDEKPRSKRNL